MPCITQKPRALLDADEIWQFVYEQSGDPDQADAVIDRIDSVLTLLARHPKMGKARAGIKKDLRSFAVYHYLIFYYPLQDGIGVVRILHGSRDLETIDFDENDEQL
jgi:toxin ParE1/3/4